MRAELHHLLIRDDPRRGDPAYLVSLDGRITWVERVNPGRGAKLRDSFNRILTNQNRPSQTG